MYKIGFDERGAHAGIFLTSKSSGDSSAIVP